VRNDAQGDLNLYQVEQPRAQRVGGAPSVAWMEFIRARTGYVLRRHAPEELVQALYLQAAEGQARRVDSCGSLWAEYRDPQEGGYVWHLLRCRSRWCPYCGSVWQRDVSQRLQEAGTPPGTFTTVATVTTGRRIESTALRDCIKWTVKTWKRWRQWAEDYGVRGGIYSIEVVPPPRDEPTGWHVHLHAVLVVDGSAPWVQADNAFLQAHPNTRRRNTTPALVWFVRSWAHILRRWWPDRYEDLPETDSLLPSIAEDWPGITVPVPGRVAVCDIGGRWPPQDPEKRREYVQPLARGRTVDDLHQALKYVAKPLAQEERPEVGAWCDLIKAMAGRRRAQTWGCWYGVSLTEPEDTEAEEDAQEERVERTGAVLLWTHRERPDISMWIGAYWYGWIQSGRLDYGPGYVLATVASRQDLEDGG